MLVAEVGIDNKTGMESYRLLYYSPVEGSEDLPWNQTPSVATILADGRKSEHGHDRDR